MSRQKHTKIWTATGVDKVVVHELAGRRVTSDDAGAEPGRKGEQNGGGDRPGPP